jgi:MFS family permease
LWRKVFRRFGVRGMMLGSAALSTAAATLTTVAEASGQWGHVWAFGTVFLMATVAGQAVFAAAISWISVVAEEAHRGTLIAFSSTLVAVESMALAAILNRLAQNHSTLWPDVIVLMLAIGAGFASLGAPPSETRRTLRRRVRVALQDRPFPTGSPSVSLQAA